ncbi:hypothetical protein BB558_005643 [Smittium angustum]|uniref:Rho-GAP domain-containing protein n=1 Tax=Smittium angustum TaxID=133377 RepID=A0A2U1IZX2_SMIAN|nr:hypothetical protein BB558_005643 [Smittium angustum]
MGKYKASRSVSKNDSQKSNLKNTTKVHNHKNTSNNHVPHLESNPKDKKTEEESPNNSKPQRTTSPHQKTKAQQNTKTSGKLSYNNMELSKTNSTDSLIPFGEDIIKTIEKKFNNNDIEINFDKEGTNSIENISFHKKPMDPSPKFDVSNKKILDKRNSNEYVFLESFEKNNTNSKKNQNPPSVKSYQKKNLFFKLKPSKYENKTENIDPKIYDIASVKSYKPENKPKNFSTFKDNSSLDIDMSGSKSVGKKSRAISRMLKKGYIWKDKGYKTIPFSEINESEVSSENTPLPIPSQIKQTDETAIESKKQTPENESNSKPFNTMNDRKQKTNSFENDKSERPALSLLFEQRNDITENANFEKNTAIKQSSEPVINSKAILDIYEPNKERNRSRSENLLSVLVSKKSIPGSGSKNIYSIQGYNQKLLAGKNFFGVLKNIKKIGSNRNIELKNADMKPTNQTEHLATKKISGTSEMLSTTVTQTGTEESDTGLRSRNNESSLSFDSNYLTDIKPHKLQKITSMPSDTTESINITKFNSVKISKEIGMVDVNYSSINPENTDSSTMLDENNLMKSQKYFQDDVNISDKLSALPKIDFTQPLEIPERFESKNTKNINYAEHPSTDVKKEPSPPPAPPFQRFISIRNEKLNKWKDDNDSDEKWEYAKTVEVTDDLEIKKSDTDEPGQHKSKDKSGKSMWGSGLLDVFSKSRTRSFIVNDLGNKDNNSVKSSSNELTPSTPQKNRTHSIINPETSLDVSFNSPDNKSKERRPSRFFAVLDRSPINNKKTNTSLSVDKQETLGKINKGRKLSTAMLKEMNGWSFPADIPETINEDSTKSSPTRSTKIITTKAENENTNINQNTNASNLDSEKSIFGLGLEEAVKKSQLIPGLLLPAFVVRCIECLEIHGLKEVGIYRISGGLKSVNILKSLFTPGRDIVLSDLKLDVHSVSTVFKQYLRELPEPLLTDNLFDEFNTLGDQCPKAPSIKPNENIQNQENLFNDENIISNKTSDLQQEFNKKKRDWVFKLKKLVDQLPVYNYILLKWLFFHLMRVSFYSNINKMTLSNLGLIFCPTLKIRSDIFFELAKNSEYIFSKDHYQKQLVKVKSKTTEELHATKPIKTGIKSLEDLPPDTGKLPILSPDLRTITKPEKLKNPVWNEKHLSENRYTRPKSKSSAGIEASYIEKRYKEIANILYKKKLFATKRECEELLFWLLSGKSTWINLVANGDINDILEDVEQLASKKARSKSNQFVNDDIISSLPLNFEKQLFKKGSDSFGTRSLLENGFGGIGKRKSTESLSSKTSVADKIKQWEMTVSSRTKKEPKSLNIHDSIFDPEKGVALSSALSEKHLSGKEKSSNEDTKSQRKVSTGIKNPTLLEILNEEYSNDKSVLENYKSKNSLPRVKNLFMDQLYSVSRDKKNQSNQNSNETSKPIEKLNSGKVLLEFPILSEKVSENSTENDSGIESKPKAKGKSLDDNKHTGDLKHSKESVIDDTYITKVGNESTKVEKETKDSIPLIELSNISSENQTEQDLNLIEQEFSTPNNSKTLTNSGPNLSRSLRRSFSMGTKRKSVSKNHSNVIDSNGKLQSGTEDEVNTQKPASCDDLSKFKADKNYADSVLGNGTNTSISKSTASEACNSIQKEQSTDKTEYTLKGQASTKLLQSEKDEKKKKYRSPKPVVAIFVNEEIVDIDSSSVDSVNTNGSEFEDGFLLSEENSISNNFKESSHECGTSSPSGVENKPQIVQSPEIKAMMGPSSGETHTEGIVDSVENGISDGESSSPAYKKAGNKYSFTKKNRKPKNVIKSYFRRLSTKSPESDNLKSNGDTEVTDKNQQKRLFRSTSNTIEYFSKAKTSEKTLEKNKKFLSGDLQESTLKNGHADKNLDTDAEIEPTENLLTKKTVKEKNRNTSLVTNTFQWEVSNKRDGVIGSPTQLEFYDSNTKN